MRLAVHLTPSKGLPKEGLRESLHNIAETGYRNVEVTGIVDTSAEAFRTELDEAGLNVVAYEVELHDLSARTVGITEEAKALGADWIVIKPVYIDEFGDGWHLTGERLTKLASKLRESGFRVAYRHGRSDLNKDGDRAGLESLLVGSGPMVSAVLDLDTSQKTKEGPVEWLKRLKGRAMLTQVKFKVNGMGDGSDDRRQEWREILDTAEETGVEWAVVELENKTDHLVDDARVSHEFFSSLGIKD